MSSEETQGALGGAAEGAATGAAIGSVVPGIGTAVGAVVGGIIGGIGGLFGGKSKKYARKANAQQRKIERTEGALARRNVILEGYIARAQSVAAAGAQDEGGGLESSAPLGAISSVGSQLEFNLGFIANQKTKIDLRDKYAKKSAKYAGYANSIGSIIESGQSFVSAFNIPGSTPANTASGSNTSTRIRGLT